MHAQSTALKDPIHGTLYGNVMGDPTKEGIKSKAGKYPVYLQCHAPNAAKDKTTRLDAKPAYSEGVNCVACHTLSKFKGTKGEDGKLKLGLKAYETANNLQGPQGFPTQFTAGDDMFGGVSSEGDEKPNPHLGEDVELDGKVIASMPMSGNARLLKTNDACMGGRHDSAMLKRAVVFYVTSEVEGDKLKTIVTMKNKQPHSLPTGAPFRNIYVKLTAYDANGDVLWQNADGHPGKSDSQAYLMYEITDDAGVHTSPPKATKLGPDTRLKPFETRTLTYDIPAKDVAVVRGEMFYNLLWPGLVKKFTKLPQDLVAPVSIATSEVTF